MISNRCDEPVILVYVRLLQQRELIVVCILFQP